MDINLNVSSKRSYTDLADYAAQQGAPEAAFANAGWKLTTHKGRPALEYPTKTGNRWRYLDGKEPRHDSPTGYKACWYGLQKAVALAENDKPLVLVNGAAGVIVGQPYGIPAFALSTGESGRISDPLITELKKAWNGKIVIALDCDPTGQKSAAKRARQLLDAGYTVRAVDLQLNENGDIADFCKIHETKAIDILQSLPELAPEPIKPKFVARDSAIPKSSPSINWKAEWQYFWSNVILPQIDQKTTAHKGKHFRCINPLHEDKNPSARITEQGIYICTCGSHSQKKVAQWLGLDFRQWWQEKRKPLIPAKSTDKRKRTRNLQRAVHNPARLPSFTANLTVNLPYITELDDKTYRDKRTLALKSGTGTGKTELFKRFHQTIPDNASVLVITHRVSLVKGIAKRLGIQDYQDFSELKGKDRQLVSSVWQIVSTVDSLHLQAGRKFDYVIIDEAGQTLRHLIDGGTLGKRTIDTYEILKQILSDAHHVWFADANFEQL